MQKKILLLLIPFLLVGCTSSNSNSGNGGSGSGGSSGGESNTKAGEVYRKARIEATTADQFKYNFSLSAKLKYKDAVNWSPAKISGTTSYNAGAGETTYLQKRSTSGLLLIDSTTYTYNKGTTFIKIAENDSDFSITDTETVTSTYNFESKTFGKLLNYLDNDKLDSVKYKDGLYNLSIKPSSKKESVNSIIQFIDCNKIVDAISTLTESQFGVSLNLTTTVEIQNEHIKTFNFAFTVSVDDFAVELSYVQTYTHIGSGVVINVPTFNNVVTEGAALDSLISKGKTALTNSKKAEISYYDYKLKTAVDHGISKSNPLGMAVNSTSAGKARRKILNNVVYFNNRLELDSDYKNKDQYPNDIEDYERYRAKLSDGTVYDCEDKVWPASNVYTKLNNYSNSNIDEYYMLLPERLFSSEYIKIGRQSTDKSGNTIIKYGLSGNAIKTLLETYNDSIRLDADLTKIIDVYDINTKFNAKRLDFEMTINSNNKIETIELVTKGFYIMNGAEQVKFGFDLSIDYDWTVTTFDIPTKTSEIALD